MTSQNVQDPGPLVDEYSGRIFVREFATPADAVAHADRMNSIFSRAACGRMYVVLHTGVDTPRWEVWRL